MNKKNISNDTQENVEGSLNTLDVFLEEPYNCNNIPTISASALDLMNAPAFNLTFASATLTSFSTFELTFSSTSVLTAGAELTMFPSLPVTTSTSTQASIKKKMIRQRRIIKYYQKNKI